VLFADSVFLRDQKDLATAVCSVMIVCWAVASPTFGAVSDKIGRRKPLYVSGCVVAVVRCSA